MLRLFSVRLPIERFWRLTTDHATSRIAPSADVDDRARIGEATTVGHLARPRARVRRKRMHDRPRRQSLVQACASRGRCKCALGGLLSYPANVRRSALRTFAGAA